MNLIENCTTDLIWSGHVFRVFISEKNEFYFTDQVIDFMVFETGNSDTPLGILIISGYKAGKICFTFPDEAYSDSSKYAINISWIKDNIYDYFFLKKNVDRIFILDNQSILPF